MMRRCIDILPLLLLLLWGAVCAQSTDVLITTQDLRVEQIRIRAFDGTASTPQFEIEKLSGGKLTGEVVTFPAAQVKLIEFRDPEDREKAPQGRVGHVEGIGGDRRNHLVIEAAQRGPDGMTFRVRLPGEPPGGKTLKAKSDQVRGISFGPPPLSLMGDSSNPAATPAKAREAGTATTAPGATPAPAPPAAAGPAATPVGATRENPFGVYTPGSGDEKSPPRSQVTTEDAESDEEEEVGNVIVAGRRSTLSGSGSGGGMLPAALVAMGMLTVGAVLGIIVLIGFVVGTIALMFSAKNEGINDLKLPRALACSALLATVPQALFIGVFLIPLPLPCFVQLIGATCLWYFSARMIVAGMLEVLEGRANDVLISYYATFVALLMIVWIYFQVTGK